MTETWFDAVSLIYECLETSSDSSMRTCMMNMISVRAAFVVMLMIVAVIDASAQCRVESYDLIADVGSRGGAPVILPGFNGELYLLLQRNGPDVLSNGAYSEYRGRFLLKYNAAHELLWWRDIRSIGNLGMALDSNGRLLLTGLQGIIGNDTLATGIFPFIARLADNGDVETVISIRSARDVNEITSTRETRIAVSREHIYYVGRRLDTAGFILVQMDYQGNPLWTRHAEIGRYGYDGIDGMNDIAVDATGSVYLAGQYLEEVVFGNDTIRSTRTPNSINSTAFFVVGWNADGEYQWGFNRIRRSGNDVGNLSNQFLTVSDGSLYVAAHDPDGARFANGADTIPVGPLFLAKLSLAGKLQWARSYDFSTAGARDRDLDIEAGADGTVILSVSSEPSGRGVFRYGGHDSLAVGARDQVIARYDRDGNVLCAMTLAEKFWTDIGTDRGGDVYIAGLFGDSIVFNGNDTVRSLMYPRWMAYIARLGSQPLRAPLQPAGKGSVAVYPNPSTGTITLSLSESTAGALQVSLTDVSGTVVHNGSYEPAGGSVQISVADLPSGLYLLRATGTGIDLQQRIVIAR